jgi:hypothetical protein
MALLGSSVWTNDDEPSKKKASTMRRTIKRQPELSNLENINDYNNSPDTLMNVRMGQESRTARVNELMTQMASHNQENDGNSLSDFKPLSNPELTVSRNDIDDTNRDETGMEKSSNVVGMNNIHGPPAPPMSAFNRRGGSTDFSSNNSDLANLSNYKKSYEPPEKLNHKPYYANMGIGSGEGYENGGISNNSKVMEKINYMIHMMEEQQFERTNNVVEEFLLYSFLGIFIIFVVDSFSRIGKYTR